MARSTAHYVLAAALLGAGCAGARVYPQADGARDQADRAPQPGQDAPVDLPPPGMEPSVEPPVEPAGSDAAPDAAVEPAPGEPAEPPKEAGIDLPVEVSKETTDAGGDPDASDATDTAPKGIDGETPEGGDALPEGVVDMPTDTAVEMPPTASHILINEVNTAGTDWVELFNPTSAAVDVSYWTVGFGDDFWADDYFVTDGRTIPGGGLLVVVRDYGTDTVETLYTNDSPFVSWSTSSEGNVYLRDAAYAGVDYVGFHDGGAFSNKPSDLAFSGPPLSATGAIVRRRNRADTDTTADFEMSAAATATKGALNPGQ